MKSKITRRINQKKKTVSGKMFSKTNSTFFPPTTQSDSIKKTVEPVISSSGHSLPAETKKFFEPRFGLSFDQIQIHTGEAASRSAEKLQAEAYSYKDHIVFNEGKYKPQTNDGINLLAHELAHSHLHNTANSIFLKGKATPVPVATPAPRGAVKKSGGGFTVKAGYITIDVLPDVLKSATELPKGANTYFNYVKQLSIPAPDYQIDQGKVKSFVAFPALVFHLSVETRFGINVNPSGPSDYGYGTRPQDKGTKATISFHEGSHGTEFIAYIKKEISKYPLPKFEGKIGMTEQEFLIKYTEYSDKVAKVHKMTMDAVQDARVKVDCAGKSIDKHNLGKQGYVNICP